MLKIQLDFNISATKDPNSKTLTHTYELKYGSVRQKILKNFCPNFSLQIVRVDRK